MTDSPARKGAWIGAIGALLLLFGIVNTLRVVLASRSVAVSPATPAPAPAAAGPLLSTTALHISDFGEWTEGVVPTSDSPAAWLYPRARAGLMLWLTLPSLTAPAGTAEIRKFDFTSYVATSAELDPTIRSLLSYVRGSPEAETAEAWAAALPANLGPVPTQDLYWRQNAYAPEGWRYTVEVEALLADEGTRVIRLKEYRLRVRGENGVRPAAAVPPPAIVSSPSTGGRSCGSDPSSLMGGAPRAVESWLRANGVDPSSGSLRCGRASLGASCWELTCELPATGAWYSFKIASGSVTSATRTR